MLWQRVVNVTAGTAFACAVTILAPAVIFSSILCLIALLAFNEFLRMNQVQVQPGLYAISLAFFVALDLTFLFAPQGNPGLGLILITLAMLTLCLFRQRVDEKQLQLIAVIIVGMAYVSSLPYFMTLVRLFPHGREDILILGIGTGVRDVGAFIWGRFMSHGHSIVHVVNPRKTYEGALFGLVLTALAISITGTRLTTYWSIAELVTLGLLIGVFGQVGDLVESWLKRSTAKKDSSHILPGQGGILDAIDGFIFTAPVTYLYIVLLARLFGAGS